MPSFIAQRANLRIERARPLLGTLVSIRIEGLDPKAANALADTAFEEIALIHRLMSFQDPASELSKINLVAMDGWIALDPRTATCLRCAIDFAGLSDGAFDPVAAGSIGLPSKGNWRAIEMEGDAVRFTHPARIDLSGIAKGYAVDQAAAILQVGGAETGVVNAGGDLRAFGPIEESVALRPFDEARPAIVLVADGALASSDTRSSRAQHGQTRHINGRDGNATPDRFVSVAAPTCIDADALTKIVLAQGQQSAALLAELGAVAYCHDENGWVTIGSTA